MEESESICPRLFTFDRHEKIKVLAEGWTRWLVEKEYGIGPGSVLNPKLMERLNEEFYQENIESIILDSLSDVYNNAKDEFIKQAEEMITQKLHITLCAGEPIYTRSNSPFRTNLHSESPTNYELEFIMTDGLDEEEHDWIVEHLPGPVVGHAPDEEFRS